MKIHQDFRVDAPKAKVWKAFHDVTSVVECLPGAELLGTDDDGRYRGKLSARLGPISTSFEGTATVTFDDETSTVTIKGSGVDRRGGSRGQVMVVCDVADADTGTKVGMEADITLSGAAAQFGRTGLISEISQRLISDFARCLEGKLAATPEVAATIVAPRPAGLALVSASLWSRLRALIRQVFRRKPAAHDSDR